jgi:rhamnogalacturonyl hydrolase YesR
LEREDFYQYGIKAVNFTLEAQNEDGSFFYNDLTDGAVYNIPESSLKRIDHYHTGFVLRSLYSIYTTINEKRVYNALSLAYNFYRDNLFEDMKIPKWTPDNVYPVNIHSCAEAILCMSTLSDLFPDALEYAQNVFLWTRKKMQDKNGHFYYSKDKHRTNRMPYIRWGQAWMMRAMASLLSQIQK